MKIAVIIPAAGVGRRFAATGSQPASESGTTKVEADLCGQPVFMRSVELFIGRPGVEQILLAINPDHVADFKFRWGDKLGFHGVKVIPGGRADRWETVLKALEVVDEACTHVAVHDGARALTGDALIRRVFEAADRYPAVIPALPVNATLKQVCACNVAADESQDVADAILGPPAAATAVVQRVVKTVDRSGLVAVQTPQVFELGLLRRAYARITAGEADTDCVTDDASLVEAMGEPVYVVDGEATNIKITRAEDLELAAAVIEKRRDGAALGLGKKRLFLDEDD